MWRAQRRHAPSHSAQTQKRQRGKPGARTPFTPEELLESGVGIYLRGLGLIAAD